ncbi:MAG: lysoplasmalogenase [Acidimicrobiia bacterium]|nr:lysoplasmalogenase [Acidimicrobiia bacterium]
MLTPAFAAAVAITALCACLDWVAVARGSKPLEYVFKPVTMCVLFASVVLLAATAEGLDGFQVACWLVAIALSLAGDVFLMLPRDLFVPGLASFLLGHVAYIVGLSVPPLHHWWPLVVAALVVVAVALPLARRILAGVAGRERGPVAAYITVISLMVVVALTQPWRQGPPVWAGVVAALGALLFYASDAMIGWRRFVGRFGGVDLAIIVTYHVGQVCLVAALFR